MEFVKKPLLCFFCLVGVQALLATLLLAWRLAVSENASASWAFAVAVAAALLIGLWRWRAWLRTHLLLLGNALAAVSSRRWLILIVTAGILLRLAWIAIYPAQAASDGAIYFSLAANLSEGGEYAIAGSRAYWPPGYPLFLAFWFNLFRPSLGAVIALNLALFAGTIVVVHGLANRVASPATARLATLLIALWPSYLCSAGLPEKELVLVFLIPLILWLYLSISAEHRMTGRRVHLLLVGGLLGFGSLVQPSLQLFPLVLLAADLLHPRPVKPTLMRLAWIITGMLVVVSPWTLRNYQVFNEFVLISTNGGSTLYRANNSLATGGYSERGEIDLSDYDELTKNRTGFQLASLWISKNPTRFLTLAFKKQLLFLGDDSAGIYSTLRRGGAPHSSIEYFIWKGLANAFWLTIWGLVIFGLMPQLCVLQKTESGLVLLVLAFLYLYSLHSIFESGSKYHVPMLGVMAVLAALSVRPLPANSVVASIP